MVVALAKVADALEAARARMLARWDADRTWADNGSRSAASRLWNETRCAPVTARVLVARARGLRHAPETARAFNQGRLSTDRADGLVRLNTTARRERFLEAEAELVAMSETLPDPDLGLALGYWRVHADAEAAPDPNHPTNGQGPVSELYVSSVFAGTVDVHGTLGVLDGEAFRLELERLTNQVRLADEQAGVERPPAARRAAALVDMAHRSAAKPKGAKRPAPLISVLMGHQSFERMCQTAGGQVLHPDQLVPHLDHAMVESILFDGAHTVITVSHKRTFTGALRRAIQVRDRRCQHQSGCDVPLTDTDVDHIVPHAQGGKTSQFNGDLNCTPHNRLPWLRDHRTPRPEQDITPLEAARLKARYLHLRWLDQQPPPNDPDPP